VSDQNPQPLQEEALDKLVELVEGPMNTLGEKVLSSKLVLAPLSLSLDLTFRALARVMGRRNNNKRAQ
jgi:hypothetical protein